MILSLKETVIRILGDTIRERLLEGLRPGKDISR